MHEINDYDIESAIRMWDDTGTIGVLVSGPIEKRQAWAFDIWPEVFDGRGNTNRCFLWFRKGEPLRERLVAAAESAKKHDVTLQLLCVGKPCEETRKHYNLGCGTKASVAEMEEWYPILNEGSDGDKWPSKRRKRKK